MGPGLYRSSGTQCERSWLGVGWGLSRVRRGKLLTSARVPQPDRQCKVGPRRSLLNSDPSSPLAGLTFLPRLLGTCRPHGLGRVLPRTGAGAPEARWSESTVGHGPVLRPGPEAPGARGPWTHPERRREETPRGRGTARRLGP